VRVEEHDLRVLRFTSILEQETEWITEGMARRASSRARETASEATQFVIARAKELCAALERRWEEPLVAYYRGGSMLAGATLWFCGLLLVIGAASNYLGKASEVNLLYNPFTLLMMWQVGVYIAWLFLALRKRTTAGLGLRLMNLLQPIRSLIRKRWLLWHDRTEKAARIAKLTQAGWRAQKDRLLVYRVMLWMHLCFICLVSGVLLGMYWRGLVIDFRFRWQSTFIRDPESLQTLLDILTWPGALIGIQAPRLGPVHELLPGAQWIHWFAYIAVCYIVIPRALMALWSYTRVRRLRSRLTLPTDDLHIQSLTSLFLGRPSLQVHPISYSYRLEPPRAQLIESKLRAALGSRLEITPYVNVRWGSDPAPPRPESEGEKPEIRQVTCLIFNAAQTPEDEVHGAFLGGFDQHPVLVLIDHSRLESSLIESRRELWRDLVEKYHSNAQMLWLDLDEDVDHERLKQQVAGLIGAKP